MLFDLIYQHCSLSSESFTWLLLLLLLLLLLIYSFKSFSHQGSLSDSKFPQVSKTFSILSNLNAVVWMVSTRPLISKSSSPFIIPLMTISSTPIITAITVTFMLPSFFQFPIKVFLFAFF